MVCQVAGPTVQRLEFEYDRLGRRTHKVTKNGSGGIVSDLKYVYDDWNLIAELDGQTGNALKRSYLWGLDLSGSLQGAGGVGGLLVATHYSPTSHHFASYDGNGNLVGLYDSVDGTISAQYEYGPFGEPIRVSPSLWPEAAPGTQRRDSLA
jgi:hypothetical protein